MTGCREGEERRLVWDVPFCSLCWTGQLTERYSGCIVGLSRKGPLAGDIAFRFVPEWVESRPRRRRGALGLNGLGELGRKCGGSSGSE